MAELCGAKTRSGGKCQKAPIKNKARCKFHGGKSTGAKDAARPGNTNAVTHGIFERQFTDQERIDSEAVEIGNLDAHIRLHNIRLARALAAEHKAQNQPELEEITENADGGENVIPRETKKFKRQDYVGIIDKITARIESLEKTRAALIASHNAPNTDDMLRDDTFIAPDERIPDAPIL